MDAVKRLPLTTLGRVVHQRPHDTLHLPMSTKPNQDAALASFLQTPGRISCLQEDTWLAVV